MATSQEGSGIVMRKTVRRRVVLCSLAMLLMYSSVTSAKENPRPLVRHAESFAVSPSLRDLARLPLPLGSGLSRVPASNFSIGLNFLGLGNGFPNYSPGPGAPDTSLAVGATQVVQSTANVFAVFDKSSGQIEAGPILANTIRSNLVGSKCANAAGAQPIVEWDIAHQRWLLTANTLGQSPYDICIAVSTSSDALGTYYLYAYSDGAQPRDSPKWGIWSNGYYQTEGIYFNSSYVGPQLCAFNSAKLLIGDGSAEQICFVLSPPDGLPIPADIDSSLLPPANEDEFFMSLWNSTNLSLYSLHPDYQNPQNSTVTGNDGSQLISVPHFTPACNGSYDGNCVPQQGSGMQLQVLGDRMLYRFAYWEDTPQTSVRATPPRPLPMQHWYAGHDSTASGGNEAPRWYEFTAPIRAVPVTSISLFQSGTYAPDSNYRWMGSIARDKKYDILLGYSESSSSMYPSIAITGRTLTDPLGTMEDELTVVHGMGPGGPSWGNYSSMRIDQDGCTFWYTNEYYMANASEWSTQIASARFANCQ